MELLETALEQPEFFERIQKLAKHYAKRSPHLEATDLASIGWEAAALKIQDYDPDKSELAEFLHWAAFNAMRRAARKERRNADNQSKLINEPVIADRHRDGAPDLDEFIDSIDYETLLQILDTDEPGQMMVTMWSEGYQWQDIADEAGLQVRWTMERTNGCLTRIGENVVFDVLECRD